jgi:membrane protein YqaA with SNARE-associated domain
MRWFGPLYDLAMRWARHAHAQWYLAMLSFAESSFFPIPPDVMLAPMSLARPERARRYALLTTLASVLGGVLGYLLGLLAFHWVEPLLIEYGYHARYLTVREWFEQWGFWAVFLAGFSPIPYKLFTISAGVVAMNMPVFLLASTIGRGTRFFIVACLMARGGPAMEARLRRHIDWLGWLTVAVVIVIVLISRS